MWTNSRVRQTGPSLGAVALVAILATAAAGKDVASAPRPVGAQHVLDGQRASVERDTSGRPSAPGAARPAGPDTVRLSRERAEALALERNPFLRAARRAEGVARGERRQAGVYPYNPRVEFESERIDPPAGDGRFDRFEAAFAQEIEWAGQWGLRQDAAEHELSRARASGEDAERRTLRDVREAYYAAAAAERKLAVAEEIAALNRRLRDAVSEQLAVGEVSALDANLARIEHGRARGRVLTARRERRSAALELTRVVGLDPDSALAVAPAPGPEPEEVGLPDPAALETDSLIRVALRRRPDLLASEAAVDRDRERESLARREAIPNLRLLVPIERRDPAGTPSLGLGVGLSLPLWNRNQGTADARQASLLRSRARRAGVALRIRTGVRDAVQAYRSASEEARTLRESVLLPARENQRLLEQSYRAGKIDLPTLLLLRNQLLDAELAYWDAWLGQRRAYARLRAAVGESATDPTEEER